MPQWTALLGAALEAHLRRRKRLLGNEAYWTRNTGAIQRRQLRALLSAAAGTEFGRDHAFGRLARLPEADLLPAYRAAVPVADWDAFKGAIARMREGAEPDVLWPGLVRHFALSSGTTAGGKYIPVSRAMLRSNRAAAMDIFANLSRLGTPLPSLTAGRVLFLGGSTEFQTSERGIHTGDLSGIVTPLIRWPATLVYSPGRDIALISDWNQKIEAMAEACLTQDVRMISGMPSWALVLFERLLHKAREKGRRAGTIREIWPNLRVFVHGGVNYGPFAARVRQFWSGSGGGDLPVRFEVYPASEGFIAMQDARAPETGDRAPLRLCSDIGLFFEFVPLERIDDPNPEAFAADEVERGRKYVVVLSTCAGFWRFILGDVVEFGSVPDGPGRPGSGPSRLRIVGRHRQFMNAFGENLIADYIESGVAEGARESGLVVGEFTAAPFYERAGEKARIELAVEVDPGPTVPSPEALARFAGAFDRRLRADALDYNTKRTSDVGLGPPLVTTLPVGTVHRWMQAQGKLGGQHKCPRCANHREIIEGILRHRMLPS
jgi:hypothetical protein